MRIPDSTLEDINLQADLVAIIRKHTTLKPSSGQFKGCCPFHQEKTPSFHVNPNKNLYHCFGCGASGNAITFLMEYEKLTFIEAVKELARQTGISLPTTDAPAQYYKRTAPTASTAPRQPAPPAPIAKNKRPTPKPAPPITNAAPARPSNIAPVQTSHLDGTLHGLLQAVSDFYHNQLAQHKSAYRYLIDRGVSTDSIQHFGLGYAPSGWQHLEAAFPHDIQGLRLLGLVRQSERGNDYDLIRDRVVFPIKDRQGRVVGFAGRELVSKEGSPKYVNSSDSPVFNKGQILYGYYEARLARATQYLVVEGYMDVIALHQAGIYGAVAPMGTAMNADQIKFLLRYNDTLTLCFDGDSAGQKAAMRTLEVALPVLLGGKHLKFLTLPDGHDPDTYISAHGAEAMRTAIDNALSLSDYLYGYLRSHFHLNSVEQKADAMAFVQQLIDQLPKENGLKWLLKSEMYQRIRGKQIVRLPQTPKRKREFHEQLLLCILYQPTLIEGDALQQFYERAGLSAIDEQFTKTIKALPPLPSWDDLAVPGLLELLDAAQSMLGLFEPSSDRRAIDTHAQMILGTIDNEPIRTQLQKQWREFFYETEQNPIGDIHLLFYELLGFLIVSCLKNAQAALADSTEKPMHTLRLSKLYKQRLLALEKFIKNDITAQIDERSVSQVVNSDDY